MEIMKKNNTKKTLIQIIVEMRTIVIKILATTFINILENIRKIIIGAFWVAIVIVAFGAIKKCVCNNQEMEH